jgi:hypothetical protein
MASPVDASQTWTDEFQKRFGIAPGSQDERVELERWKQLCQELLAERDQLRVELARVQKNHDMYHEAFGALMKKELAKYAFTKESLLAESAGQPSLQQLVAELERDEGR